ncbi:GNAT family N-acetyltransferase [Limnospira fusiformis CCALA 023]|uniref:GNAT family N-acetyltransferase n=1 Tax=Oscillatoriales TaxID=1150 RepID=UPI00396D5F21
MNLFPSPNQTQATIRPFQYRDLEAFERLSQLTRRVDEPWREDPAIDPEIKQLRLWYGLLRFLSWFPNPCQHLFNTYVAEQGGQVQGVIRVSPFNRTRSTWRVQRVSVDPATNSGSIGSQLLRYCFETIWEARTWVLEVNVNDKDDLALYRQNGFQPLAKITYWSVEPELLADLAQSVADVPNLLPVSNADAQLLYQLDTVSMPPQVRQVFDRHILDFQTNVIRAIADGVRQWLDGVEQVSGYVFEPQRKAAIGYFQIQLCRDGRQPHQAELTVHPAYTWLYPELLCQMAQLVQDFPPQSLRLASVDYQPEREAYLQKVGAEPVEHTLLMSRSVWHKLRESKTIAEPLQWSEVLQSLQPSRKPVPGGMSWLGPMDRHQTHPGQTSTADSSAKMQPQNIAESGASDPN